MTKEKRCAVVKEVFSSLMLAEDNTAIYMEEMMYCVRNNIGQFLIVKAHSEDEALKKAEVTNRERFHKWCGKCGAKMDEVTE